MVTSLYGFAGTIAGPGLFRCHGEILLSMQTSLRATPTSLCRLARGPNPLRPIVVVPSDRRTAMCNVRRSSFRRLLRL